jgi:tyrosinase
MGHFAHLGYSGFDPLFMMHHAAIDRHVALWQAIHYNASMFTSTYTTRDGQFATSPGTNITADSPLKPFHADAAGTFLTANSARDISTFGYTYPELLGNYSNAEDLRRAVTRQVNELYEPSVVHEARTRRQNPSSSAKTRDYFVEISLDKAEIRLPATVNIRLGPEIVGHLVLPTLPARGTMHGEIPLRRVLNVVGLSQEAPSDIRAYLTSHLHHEIVSVRY